MDAQCCDVNELGNLGFGSKKLGFGAQSLGLELKYLGIGT